MHSKSSKILLTGLPGCGKTKAIMKIVAGLVGCNGLGLYNMGTISRCFVTGSAAGDDDIGGLVGASNYISFGHGAGIRPSVERCYAAGRISGDEYVGGLVGQSDGEVALSFWDTETSGQSTSDGGESKTTAEMQTAETFLNAGWDFIGETTNGTEDIWWILEGQDYPRLWWESAEDGE